MYVPSVVQSVLDKLQGVKKEGAGWMALCPSHTDKKASLSIGVGKEGQVLLHCFANCNVEAIVEALGINMRSLRPPTLRTATSVRQIGVAYDYQDESGNPLYQVVRKPSKDFFQRRWENGKWVPGLKGTRRVLYRLPEVIRAVAANQTVYVTEGEKDADSLRKLGLTATTNSGGAGKWLPEYSEALRGADVVVLHDNDEPGRRHRDQVVAALHGVAATIKAPDLPGLSDKGDVSDWIASGGTTERLREIIDGSPFCETPTKEALDEIGEPISRSTNTADVGSGSQRLIALGRDNTTRFRSKDDGDAFIHFPVTTAKNGQDETHSETWPVRSQPFIQWLRRQYYRETGRTPKPQAMEEAIGLLEAECRYDGAEITLSVRVARSASPDTLWLDLSDSEWRAVRVDASGWKVDDSQAIRFQRFKIASPQVIPCRGGSVECLREYVNVRNENAWYQLISWIVAAFFPDIAHPVLVVHGEHGSAKSTLMRLLSRLIDPVKTPLRAGSCDIRSWAQIAHHSWMVTLDNVSCLQQWLSDAICRAVTGESFSKRQLYTDSEDVIMTFRRIVALTGIEVVAQRADLLDRSILLHLSPIETYNRRAETELLMEFEREIPALLGALLDVVSNVLKILPSVEIDHLPRMADYARIGVAVEQVLGWPQGAFLNAYEANIASQHEEALHSSSVALSLMTFMRQRDIWVGTGTELLKALSAISIDTRGRDWPQDPKSLSGHLKRLLPNLRAVGIDVTNRREATHRLLILTREPRNEPTAVLGEQECDSMTQLPDKVQAALRGYRRRRDANDAYDEDCRAYDSSQQDGLFHEAEISHDLDGGGTDALDAFRN